MKSRSMPGTVRADRLNAHKCLTATAPGRTIRGVHVDELRAWADTERQRARDQATAVHAARVDHLVAAVIAEAKRTLVTSLLAGLELTDGDLSDELDITALLLGLTADPFDLDTPHPSD